MTSRCRDVAVDRVAEEVPGSASAGRRRSGRRDGAGGPSRGCSRRHRSRRAASRPARRPCGRPRGSGPSSRSTTVASRASSASRSRSTARSSGCSIQPRWPRRCAVRSVSTSRASAGARRLDAGDRARLDRRPLAVRRLEPGPELVEPRPADPRQDDDAAAPGDDLRQRHAGPRAVDRRRPGQELADLGGEDVGLGIVVHDRPGHRDEAERPGRLEAVPGAHPAQAADRRAVHRDGPEQLVEEGAARVGVVDDQLALDRAIAHRDRRDELVRRPQEAVPERRRAPRGRGSPATRISQSAQRVER